MPVLDSSCLNDNDPGLAFLREIFAEPADCSGRNEVRVPGASRQGTAFEVLRPTHRLPVVVGVAVGIAFSAVPHEAAAEI